MVLSWSHVVWTSGNADAAISSYLGPMLVALLVVEMPRLESSTVALVYRS